VGPLLATRLRNSAKKIPLFVVCHIFEREQTMKQFQYSLLFYLTFLAIGLLAQAATTSHASSISVGCDRGRIQVTSQVTSCSHTMLVPLALEGEVSPGVSIQGFQAFLVYQTGKPAISQIQVAWDDSNLSLITFRHLA
jgi:hypothetical protein